MTNDDKDILNIDAFTKLMKVAQDLSNFESHKTLFLRGPLFFLWQKKRHVKHQRELALLAHRCQPLTAGFLMTTSSESNPFILAFLSSQPSSISLLILKQSNSNFIKYISSKSKLYQEHFNIIHKLE